MREGGRGRSKCACLALLGVFLNMGRHRFEKPAMLITAEPDILVQNGCVLVGHSLAERVVYSIPNGSDNLIRRSEIVDAVHHCNCRCRDRCSHQVICSGVVNLADDLGRAWELRLEPRFLLTLSNPPGVVKSLLSKEIRARKIQRPLT